LPTTDTILLNSRRRGKVNPFSKRSCRPRNLCRHVLEPRAKYIYLPLKKEEKQREHAIEDRFDRPTGGVITV